MSDATSQIPFERLLAHREWVRAVARSIAQDAATADDLEQETWLEALRAPPRDERNLRGWLGAVVRNRARKRGRSGARRAHHEAAAAPGAAPASPARVVAEAEAQQRVVAAVLALEEPYRTTVLLRFYEGLPPRDVAQRMDVPAETVRTRVRRAAARLREALGGEGTDPMSWMGAVVPLLGAPAPSGGAATAAGVVTVHTKKTIAAATLAAALLGGTCAYLLALPPPPLPAPHRTASAAPRPAAATAEEPAPPVPVRAHVARSPTQPAQPAPSAGNDAEKNKENREKVRAKYTEDKGGFPFYDLVYWVDAAALEDSRWSMEDLRSPDNTNGIQLIANWVNESSAAAGMDIRVLCFKLVHEKRQGSQTSTMQMPFDNLGESVPCSDLEGIVNGFYEDWKRGAKDPIEDQCEAPRKSKYKIPKLQAAAVATDPESGLRERREWYGWTNGKEMSTYLIEIRYGNALHDKEGLIEKGGELVKNLKEIKDKVKWD